jgi:AcrR family transcriptional regulator
MPPRPDVSEERREQILEAAGTVFARMGVRDARMDDIVSEASLSKGGVYWYFKSKDELVAAFIERLLARSVEDLRQFLASDQPFAQRMFAVAHYVAADFRGSKLRGVVLEFYGLAARDAQVRRRVRAYLDRFIELFAAMIAQAIERGECRPVDPHKTATAIEATYEGLTLLWLLDTTGFQVDEMIAHATELLLNSLRPAANA